jgi:capsular polysaccharide transport system ATP-binding protein
MIRLDNVFKYYRTKRSLKIILDHVSVSFEAGRSYGILGINGAGKSTFMRLLAGSELPNNGRITRSVRVSWPLGFADGLHPRMTGKENVQFVARLFGKNPRQITEFVEDFSEVGAYIDAPIVTYSSGMLQRLSFGLSMAVDFECYLIDEVTAVGDARFQRKCYEEFDRRRQKADIIMVSHNLGTLRDYCRRGVVLANGKLHLFSEIDEAIELYKQLNI